jgi:hypothetical protein
LSENASSTSIAFPSIASASAAQPTMYLALLSSWCTPRSLRRPCSFAGSSVLVTT